MNARQRNVLMAGALVVIGMLIYPPFHFVGAGGFQRNFGYSWIFTPPNDVATVNVSVLLAQWVAVVIVVALLYIAMSKGGTSAGTNRAATQPVHTDAPTSSVARPPVRTALSRAWRAGVYCFLFFLGISGIQGLVHLSVSHTPEPTWLDFVLKKLIAAMFFSVLCFFGVWLYRLAVRRHEP